MKNFIPRALWRAAHIATLVLAASASAHAASVGFATRSTSAHGGQIIELDLFTGVTTIASATTLFEPNAAAFNAQGGANGILYYGDDNSKTLAAWDRATNTHINLGSLASNANGWTSHIVAGSLHDAAYWGGGSGIAAGYYVVAAGTDDLYRVSFDAAGTQIDDVAKIADIANNNRNLFFGDIAFNDAGLLYMRTANLPQGVGLYTFDLLTNTRHFVGASPAGQIGFGDNGVLYGSVLSGGVNSLVTLDPTTGLVLTTLNSNLGFLPNDFAIAATAPVPLPPAFAFLLPGLAGLMLSARRRHV